MPFATLAARWFPKESRSFATSIIFVGISLGGVLLSNPLTAAIEMFGWRVTYRCYGFVAMLLVSPLALIFVRDYPDGYEEQIRAEEPEGPGEKADFVTLFKDPRFLLIAVGMGCISFIGCSLYHISSYVQSLGYDAQFGATVISLYNFVCIFSKMIMGRLFDRKGLRRSDLWGDRNHRFLSLDDDLRTSFQCSDAFAHRVLLWNRKYMPEHYGSVHGFWSIWS